MKVKAAPGTKCPKEGKPRQYITDTEPVEVPASAYYRRLVAEGSLIQQSVIPVKTGIQENKGGKD